MNKRQKEAKEQVLKKFDFAKVESYPRIDPVKLDRHDLQREAEYLIDALFEDDLTHIRSGGLQARIEQENGSQVLRLEFVLEGVGSYL